MPDPSDMIIPLVQRIQIDVADTKRKVDANTDTRAHHGEKLEAIEGYLTYGLGLTSRNAADIEALQEEIKAIKRRIDTLEQ